MLMKPPRFSIIMPVYNACRVNANYLVEAFDSIVHQTFTDFEFIIVNDNSTDETETICNACIRRHPNVTVRYYKKDKNEGQSAARNYGARESRGAYLCFIDQDDVWYPYKLEKTSPCLDGNIDLIYSDADLIDGNSTLTQVGLHQWCKFGAPHPKTCVEDILYRDIYIMPGLMTIKRETFFKVGGFDERLSGMEDDDIFLKIFQAGTVEYLHVSTLKWRLYFESYGLTKRMMHSRRIYYETLMERYAQNDKVRIQRISWRFFCAFIVSALVQLKKNDDSYKTNISEARRIMPRLALRKKIKYLPFIISGTKLPLYVLDYILKIYRNKHPL